jgi:hypothetical protein
LLTEISSRGSLVVKRAYADWVRFSDWRQSVLASQIEMIELPFATKGKNSADIRLVVDAMEFVFTKPHITTFVIASADADFLPLLSRLREFNKRTIVVAGSGNTQAYMRTHCDEFMDGDAFLANHRPRKPDAKKKSSSTQPQATLRLPSPENVREIQSMLLETWSVVGPEHSFDLSQIGYQLRKLKPGLVWRDFGFKSLKPLVSYLVTHGFLRIDLACGTTNNIFLTARSKLALKSTRSKIHSSAIAMRESTTPPEMTALEWELVPIIQQLVQQELRWDELRNGLIDMHPKSSRFLQQDDDYLKLLQSLDARKTITLKYDSALSTYYVSASKVEQLQPSEYEPMANRSLACSTLWIQPELF